MFARVTTIQGSPAQAEEGMRYVQEQVIPRAKGLRGFKGGYWLADRRIGKTVGVTLWEDEASVRASEAAAAQMREEGASARRAKVLSVEVYEVFAQA